MADAPQPPFVSSHHGPSHGQRDSRTLDMSSPFSSAPSRPPPIIADVVEGVVATPTDLSPDLLRDFGETYEEFLDSACRTTSLRELDATANLKSLLRRAFVLKTGRTPWSGRDVTASSVLSMKVDISLAAFRALGGVSEAYGIVTTACVGVLGEHKFDTAFEPEARTRRGLAKLLLQLASAFEAFGTRLSYALVRSAYTRVILLQEGVFAIEGRSPSTAVTTAANYLRTGSLFTSLPHDLSSARPDAPYAEIQPPWDLIIAGVHVLSTQPLEAPLPRLPEIMLASSPTWRRVLEGVHASEQAVSMHRARDIDAYGEPVIPSLSRKLECEAGVDMNVPNTWSTSADSDEDGADAAGEGEPFSDHDEVDEEKSTLAGSSTHSTAVGTAHDLLFPHDIPLSGQKTPPYDPDVDDILPFDAGAEDLRIDPDYVDVVGEVGFLVMEVSTQDMDALIAEYVASSQRIPPERRDESARTLATVSHSPNRDLAVNNGVR